MKKLPIGIQSFVKIREDDFCYVDKTPLVSQLVDQGAFYFFSRPRRFGKSLLIDTLAQAFMGKKDLFKGLYLEHQWNWDQTFPVVQIDFAGGVLTSGPQLKCTIADILQVNAGPYAIELDTGEIHLAFSQLIRTLYQKTGQRVVVLVDEYDKPILDNITNPETALELREILRHFYSVLKAQSAHLHFVMPTGVSKFSKVSLFSGLNNLEDITLDPRFGTLCGYTQKELETVFHEYLEAVDPNMVKKWYNGYNFLSEPVYNPFNVLLYLRNRMFKPYWFETGTPTFLMKLIREKAVPAGSIDGMQVSDRFIGSFDVDYIQPLSLLFQTGYLTITEVKDSPGGVYYTLGFPNHKVRYAFNDALLAELSQSDAFQDKNKLRLHEVLQSTELDGLKQIFHAFFASIPHEWYKKNDMARFEGYYCSIVYCYFTALGLNVTVEESTNHGRLDMVVHFNKKIYIIEFKVNELTRPERALKQIKKKKYAEKYAGHETYLIGVEFSKEDRNITWFEWEKV